MGLNLRESEDLHSIAQALERIADVLEEQTKIGGALNLQDVRRALVGGGRP